MSKKQCRAAAGLNPEAVAEIKRLRAEWDALKNSDLLEKTRLAIKLQQRAMMKPYIVNKNSSSQQGQSKVNEKRKHMKASNEVLRGVVALVEVGAESRALALRAALAALGASVVPIWSPLVTHVIWAEGGSRATRAVSRSQAARLVSPLWVEACAASNRHLPEQTFPAASRPSDLPSPKTLQKLLKKAERENLPLVDLLPEKKEKTIPNADRLRMSNDSEPNISTDDTAITTGKSAAVTSETATSAEKSTDTSIDMEVCVNTAPRRALPVSMSPPPRPKARKSRRKLFTQREVPDDSSDSDAEKARAVKKRVRPAKVTQRERCGLARAERMARKLAATLDPEKALAAQTVIYSKDGRMRIVLSGMSRSERRKVHQACRALNGKIQRQVNKKTTHVLLGSFGRHRSHDPDITGVSTLQSPADKQAGINDPRMRTLSALLGAARGCRVLYAKWALDSYQACRWLSHQGYEIPHLRNIAQKAYIERHAFGLMLTEYAYDVFDGKRIRLSANAEQRNAAEQLLALCGAVVLDANGSIIHNRELMKRTPVDSKRPRNGGHTQNGANSQDGGLMTADSDIITIGQDDGEVSTRWVFDSVAGARMRSLKRYISGAGE